MACRDEFTRVKPGAVASERGDQQLPGGSNTRNVRVDLSELVLGHGSPSLLAGSGAKQLPDFGDREPGLLKKGDRRQPRQHRRVVVTTAAHPSSWPNQAHLLVVAESRALQAGRLSDLADAEQVRRHHTIPSYLRFLLT